MRSTATLGGVAHAVRSAGGARAWRTSAARDARAPAVKANCQQTCASTECNAFLSPVPDRTPRAYPNLVRVVVVLVRVMLVLDRVVVVSVKVELVCVMVVLDRVVEVLVRVVVVLVRVVVVLDRVVVLMVVVGHPTPTKAQQKFCFSALHDCVQSLIPALQSCCPAPIAPWVSARGATLHKDPHDVDQGGRKRIAWCRSDKQRLMPEEAGLWPAPQRGRDSVPPAMFGASRRLPSRSDPEG